VAEALSMSIVYAHSAPRIGAMAKAIFVLNCFSSNASSIYLIPAPKIGKDSRIKYILILAIPPQSNSVFDNMI
jgi:hypothetical protein